MPQPGLAPPAGVTPNFDNPGSKGIVYFTIFINAFGIPIVTGLLAIRMYMRHHVSRDIGKDDVCCILGYIGYIGYCTVDLLFLKYGGGLHQWNVPETSVPHYMKACYATMVIYGPAAFATRCAILLFLTRIFSPFTRYCRWIYVAIGLMGFYYALMVILKAFICRPVAKFWDPSIEGSCFNQRSLILTDNVISLVADIIVLLIPCPLVNFLKIDRMAKIRIGTVFGAGGVACICSLVRLVEIVRYGADSDLTWAFTWINSWGILEVAIGLACACFPMVAMAWKHLRRPAKRLTAHPADSGYGSGKYEMSSRGKHNVRANVRESDSDENILITSDLSDPTYVANIHGGAQTPASVGSSAASGGVEDHQGGGGGGGRTHKISEELEGITRTVDISVHATSG